MNEDNNWNAVTGDELAGFLEQINPIDGKYRTSPPSTQVAWRTLPFYENAALIRVKDPSWVSQEHYYLTDQGSLFRLNGTSPPIHEVNSKAPVKLNEGNAIEYLRFFCLFTHGDEGAFHVIESTKDLNFLGGLDESTCNAVDSLIHPAVLEGIDEKGQFLCNATIRYGSQIYRASFAMDSKRGIIEMLECEPIVVDLQLVQKKQEIAP